MQELVALRDIESNPYRRLKQNPPQRPRIDRLKESIQATGLWPRLMGRRVGRKVQLCFHHHIYAALCELYPESHKVLVEVRDASELTDTKMLQMLSRENQEDWTTDALTMLTTAGAALEAYDSGLIQLDVPAKSKITRFTVPNGKPYNVEALAQLLGWTGKNEKAARKAQWTVDALELIGDGDAAEKDFAGLTDEQAFVMIAEIKRRRSLREWEAKEAEKRAEEAERRSKETPDPEQRQAAIAYQRREKDKARQMREESKRETKVLAKNVSEDLREGRIGKRGIASKVAEIVPPITTTSRCLPDIRPGARELARNLDQILAKADVRRQKLEEITQHCDQLDQITKELLIGSLDDLAKRATKLAEALGLPTHNGSGTPTKSAGPKLLR
jgi:hypothetical protein